MEGDDIIVAVHREESFPAEVIFNVLGKSSHKPTDEGARLDVKKSPQSPHTEGKFNGT